MYFIYYHLETVLPESEHKNKIRSSANVVQLTSNPYMNGGTQIKLNGHHSKRHHHLNYLHQLEVQEKHHMKPSYLCERKNMEFLIPQVPNAVATTTANTNRQQKTMLKTNIVGSGLTLNDINNHLSENFRLIQTASGTAAQPKMTKKQLRLAQAQLDKLTQISIHLQGM